MRSGRWKSEDNDGMTDQYNFACRSFKAWAEKLQSYLFIFLQRAFCCLAIYAG
jgi:hypothetical protein